MTIAHDVSWGSPVQSGSGTSVATASHTPTAGALIVGCLLLATSKTLTSIVDSAGGTVNILPVVGPAGGIFGTGIYIFYVKNAAGTARTFTGNFGSSSVSAIMVDSFTGIGLNSPFDTTVGATATGSPISTGNTSTTRKPNELLVGYASTDSATGVTWTGASGYSGLGNSGIAGGSQMPIVGSFQIVSATGAYSYAPNYTGGSLPGVAALATFADSDISGAAFGTQIYILP